MKKILSIALVALLAVSAFASFEGKANVDFGFNFKDKAFGFSNDAKIDVYATLATEDVEKVAEGDIYAGIKAFFNIKYAEGPYSFDKDKFNANDCQGIRFSGRVKEAFIAGANWKLSILGVNDVNDFAVSAIDSYKDENKKTKYFNYKNAYVAAPGVALDVAGYKTSFGLAGKGSADLQTSATVATPDFELAEGFKLGFGASYAFVKEAKAVKNNAFGASVKTSYENDTFALAVASDLGYDFVAKKFGADVAAKFSVSPVVVDVYYATLANGKPAAVKNLLSAQVATDLTAFDVPLKLTVTGKDLINAQNLSASVVVPVAPFEFSVKGGYGIKSTVWFVGGSVKYTHDMFVVNAGLDVEKGVKLGANASIASEALVPGAKLSLAWKGAKDLLNKNYGEVVASCEIKF